MPNALNLVNLAISKEIIKQDSKLKVAGDTGFGEENKQVLALMKQKGFKDTVATRL